MVRSRVHIRWVLLLAMIGCALATAHAAECRHRVIEGEVRAGQAWSADLGQGWVFRILPIQPGPARYSGWDLVVDRVPGAGYPDALLLATLPYDSLNEREIGTTYGLRAQDAIGWNPRTFRFIADAAAFAEGQRLFLDLRRSGGFERVRNQPSDLLGADPRSANAHAMTRLLQLQQKAATGEFRILDARIVPGTADPAPYAQNWALAASRTPHENESSPQGQPGERGALQWMRFSIELWLPAKWKVPGNAHADLAACPQ